MSIINLTKFRITPDLQAFGVTDLGSWKDFQEIRNLLFFPEPPAEDLVNQRVERLGQIALAEAKRTKASEVLISCPPWVAYPLCRELVYHGLVPLVAFTKKTNESGIQIVDLVKAA